MLDVRRIGFDQPLSTAAKSRHRDCLNCKVSTGHQLLSKVIVGARYFDLLIKPN